MHSYTKLDPEIQTALQAQQAESARRTMQALEAQLQRQGVATRPDPETEPPGPTGRFPGGQLTAADEGELRFQIGTLKGKVVLNFGAPTQALGFTPEQAIGLADLLRKHAKALRPDKKRAHGGNGRGK